MTYYQQKEGVWVMEKTRKRIRILLLVVLLSAVVIGGVYYFNSMGNAGKRTDGTLISAVTGWEGSDKDGFWK